MNDTAAAAVILDQPSCNQSIGSYDICSNGEYQEQRQPHHDKKQQLCQELTNSITSISSCSNELMQISNVLSCCRHSTIRLDATNKDEYDGNALNSHGDVINDTKLKNQERKNQESLTILTQLRQLEEALCDVELRVDLFKCIINQENEALCEIERKNLQGIRIPTEESKMSLEEISQQQYHRLLLIQEHLENNAEGISLDSKHGNSDKKNFKQRNQSEFLRNGRGIGNTDSTMQQNLNEERRERTRKSLIIQQSDQMLRNQKQEANMSSNNNNSIEINRRDSSNYSCPSDEEADGSEDKKRRSMKEAMPSSRVENLNLNHSSNQINLFSFFQVQRIENDELTDIPTTIRGRTSVPVLNDALVDILNVCFDHFQYRGRSKDNNTRNNDDTNQFKHQKIILTEQELRTSCSFFRTGESSARSILLVLRALGRIQQIPSKKTDQILYTITVSSS